MQTKQLKEADTVKEKNISIRLSETDCDRITSLCGANGLTVGKLIEAFIGDLVGGTYSNGSDERILAQQWLDRCGFSILAEDTLLKYFLNNYYDIDDFLNDIDEIKSIEADLKEYEINPEKFDKEEIEYSKNDLADYREHYDELYKKIIEDFKKKHPDADIEKEIQAMMKWQEEGWDFRYEDAKEKRDKMEEMARKRVSVYKADSKGYMSECIGEFYDEKLLKDFMKYQEDKGERSPILIKNGITIEMKEKNTGKALLKYLLNNKIFRLEKGFNTEFERFERFLSMPYKIKTLETEIKNSVNHPLEYDMNTVENMMITLRETSKEYHDIINGYIEKNPDADIQKEMDSLQTWYKEQQELNSSMAKNTETNGNKEISDSDYPAADVIRRKGR